MSILVEKGLFEKMSADIDVYARRIQDRLSQTRSVILTYSADTSPALIAAANERLYFSGIPKHSKRKTQKLVGTILIGHVPLPVVHTGDTSYLSIFPYVDFDDPHFYFDRELDRFEFVDVKKTDPRADIWHSVIDPHTGNMDQDVGKIRDFFQKVYEYDAKK